MSTYNHCYTWISISDTMMTLPEHTSEPSPNDCAAEVTPITEDELDYISWGSDGGANLD